MKKLRFWGTLVLFTALLLRPEAAVRGSQSAMRLWYGSVAPALFPFFALMPMLTGAEACTAYARLFQKPMRSCFALPGTAAPAVVIGMLSGSPGGALALQRIAAETNMDRRDAWRIAFALGGVSPAYLILGVGQGLYGSAQVGMKLALIQSAVQLALLKASEVWCRGNGGKALPAARGRDHWDMRHAVENILAVCGYMVVFSALASVASEFIGGGIGSALLVIADLPSGLASLADSGMNGNLFLVGSAIGFSGLCITLQNLDALRFLGIPAGRWIAGRLVHAVLFGVAAGLLVRAEELSFTWMHGKNSYALALLLAGISILPALILFSKKYILNKQKCDIKNQEIT